MRSSSFRLASARHGAGRRSIRPCIDRLEPRVLLSGLLGINPGFPNTAYNDGSGVSYTFNGTTGTLIVSSIPDYVLVDPSALPDFISGGTLSLSIQVDSAGNIEPGSTPDFSISGNLTGVVAGPSYDGLLLQGEIEQFGFQYTGTGIDNYDFVGQLDPTNPGFLAPFFTGQDIGITLTSPDSTFTGSFTDLSFTGDANGNVGPVPSTPAPNAALGGALILTGIAAAHLAKRFRRGASPII